VGPQASNKRALNDNLAPGGNFLSPTRGHRPTFGSSKAEDDPSKTHTKWLLFGHHWSLVVTSARQETHEILKESLPQHGQPFLIPMPSNSVTLGKVRSGPTTEHSEVKEIRHF